MENPRYLIPHEDVLLEKVSSLLFEISKTRQMKPIIVDSNTHVILDGHHRHTASLLLSLRKIPVIYVNYNSSKIYVDIWYRKFSKPNAVKSILSSLTSNGSICAKFDLIKICDISLYRLYWRLEAIESFLLSLKINVIKDINGDLKPPLISKSDVIDIANRGLRFPPKTTRHVYEFIIHQSPVSIDDS